MANKDDKVAALEGQILAALGALPTLTYLPGETAVVAADSRKWFYWGSDGQAVTGIDEWQGVLRATRLAAGGKATNITTTWVPQPSLPWETQISGSLIDGFARAYATPNAARQGHEQITALLAGLLGVTPVEITG